MPGRGASRAALEELAAAYAPGERGLVLRELAGGWTLATAPEQEEAARRLLARPRTPPLTPAQAETLAIVAYLQPVSRPEITRIRGVAADSASGDAARARADRGVRPLAVRRRPLPHDAAVPEAVRPDALDDLPDPAAWDPTPDEETELRDRLLRAGDVRAAARAPRAAGSCAGRRARRARAPSRPDALAASAFAASWPQAASMSGRA